MQAHQDFRQSRTPIQQYVPTSCHQIYNDEPNYAKARGKKDLYTWILINEDTMQLASHQRNISTDGIIYNC